MYGTVLLSAFVAIEKYYRHPSFGSGIQALVAAIKAGEVLA
jgi:hypothetical protein